MHISHMLKIIGLYKKEGMKMLNIDMWYGDNHKKADKIDITFYPNDEVYRGNIYKNG